MSGSGIFLWGWDSTPGAKQWRRLEVTDTGLLRIDMSEISLDDIGDVNIAGGAEGDMIYFDAVSSTWMRGARANLAELFANLTILHDLLDVNAPAPADGDALVWDDATSLWIPAAAGAPTKEFFVPVTYGTEMGKYGEWAVAICDAADEVACMSFRVPHDFSSITTAEIVVISRVTEAAANWDIYSDYGALTEVWNAHAESDVASTYNVTSGKLTSVDISGILSALAADDYVGVKISQGEDGHNFNAIGVHFKYS